MNLHAVQKRSLPDKVFEQLLAEIVSGRYEPGAEELVAIGAELAAVGHGPDLLALDERFWRVVLDGAGNLAYQLAFNSLLRAVHARVDFSIPWLEQELARGDYRRPIAAAIASGDPEAAARATRAALAPPPGGLALDIGGASR